MNFFNLILSFRDYSSMGYVEGGAEAVICGFLDAIGREGTLVFPTLCQKDFSHSYETWHLDKQSDVGYLTNYFRKREGSYRSDQATHSVAACGKYAVELTKTHGHTNKRFGNMGDTPFSADSPWEKMYHMDAKVILLGVSPMTITFRHYVEYCYVEECLKSIEGHPEYESMRNALWCFEKQGVWPHLNNKSLFRIMEEKGLVRESRCGDALFTCFSSVEFVKSALEGLRNSDELVLWRNDSIWDTDGWYAWMEKLRKLQGK